MTTALLVVDTETGGLDPSVSCIVEIAAQVVLVEPAVLDLGDVFHTRCKPDRPVNPQAAHVNGYSVAGWADAPPLPKALDDFRIFVDAVCRDVKHPMWTGCNPIFDMKFYNSDRKRHDLLAPEGLGYRVIDVQSMAFPLLFAGEVRSLSLASLRAWAGIAGEQTHTALGDVHDTCEVIAALLLRKGIPNG